MKLGILFLAVFLFIGCATYKQLPLENLGLLSTRETTYTWTNGSKVIYRLEDDKLVGKLIFGKNLNYAGYQVEQFVLVAWFTDVGGLVLEKSSYYWKRGELNLDDKLEFVMDLPEGYKDFVYVGFSYSGAFTS